MRIKNPMINASAHVRLFLEADLAELPSLSTGGRWSRRAIIAAHRKGRQQGVAAWRRVA
jgi:hypothetical protein